MSGWPHEDVNDRARRGSALTLQPVHPELTRRHAILLLYRIGPESAVPPRPALFADVDGARSPSIIHALLGELHPPAELHDEGFFLYAILADVFQAPWPMTEASGSMTAFAKSRLGFTTWNSGH